MRRLLAFYNIAEYAGFFALPLVVLPLQPGEQMRGHGRTEPIGSAHAPTSTFTSRMDPREAIQSNPPLYRRSDAKRETYGFVLYVFASVLWVLWCLWAMCPEWLLIRVGIEWFPRRDWAYVLISWSLVAVLTVYFTFGALNMYHTPPIDSLDCVTDDRANIYDALSKPLPPMTLAETGYADSPLCDDVYDLYPGLVSRALYLNEG